MPILKPIKSHVVIPKPFSSHVLPSGRRTPFDQWAYRYSFKMGFKLFFLKNKTSQVLESHHCGALYIFSDQLKIISGVSFIHVMSHRGFKRYMYVSQNRGYFFQEAVAAHLAQPIAVDIITAAQQWVDSCLFNYTFQKTQVCVTHCDSYECGESLSIDKHTG